MQPSCPHIDAVTPANEHKRSDYQKLECQECVKQGDEWMHLRICQSCGAVLCCDSSPNQHARRHYNATRHPVIRSAEIGEDWRYCFDDDVMLNP